MFSILLYGLGKEYRTYRNYLHMLEQEDQINIVGVSSSDDFELSEIDGWKYWSYNLIQDIKCDYIIIFSEKHEHIIVDELLDLGIERNKLISCRIFDIPLFNFNNYITLRKSKISVISRTCMGGMLFHCMGLEYLSPFKNMNISDEDYIKLLNNFHHYISSELYYSGTHGYNSREMKHFPIMKLDDIFIRFPHSTRSETVLDEWNKRKSKFNFDNIFVLNFTESENIAEEFSKIPFRNKICFTNFPTDISQTLFIPNCRNYSHFEELVHLFLCKGNLINPIDLLMGKKFDVKLFKE